MSDLQALRCYVVSCTLALALSATVLAPQARATAPSPGALPDLGQKADAAYQSEQWLAASGLYRRLAELQPANPRNWMRLAVSLHKLGQNAPSLEALEKARQSGAPASAVKYETALIEAANQNETAALDALGEAVAQGRGRPDLMLAEADFHALHHNSRFVALVAQARKNDAPCEYRSESRQFDFWLGDWSVSTTQEHTSAGRSHIESAIGGCAIWENWTSSGDSGYTGKSYNSYNVEQKRWEQFWVDNQGGMIHFTGGLEEGVMDFRTEEIPQPDGTVLQRHLRFFKLPTGQVRQLSEGSTDKGRTWSVEYDFTYTRSP